MTRRDYETLRACLVNARPEHVYTTAKEYDAARTVWLACVYSISLELSLDNPSFDRDRFHDACGVDNV